MPNVVSLACPSLQISEKTQTCVFLISRFLVKFLVSRNCHDYKTINDINIKLRPITKFDKRITTTSRKFDDVIISANYDVFVIILTFGGFLAIRKPYSGRMIFISNIFINKAELRKLQHSSIALSYYCFE